MPTVVTKTVGPSGRDYTSLSAAITGEAAARADLVTRDEQLVFEIHSGLSVEGSSIALTGFTCDATRNLVIQAASGDEFLGVYSSSTVARVASSVSFGFTLDCDQCFVTLKNIIFENTSISNSRAATFLGDGSNGSIRVENCMFVVAELDKGVVSIDSVSMSEAHFINCIFLRGEQSLRVASRAGKPVYVTNCVMVGADNLTTIDSTGGDAAECFVTNTVIWDCAATTSIESGIVADYNATEDGAGTNAVTLTASPFNDYANGDYTPAPGGALEKAGINPAAGFATDITGETRAYWDIGAFAADAFEDSLVQTITVDPTKVPSDQGSDLSSAGIPLFYDLSNAGSDFWDTVANGGGDIRVFENDGVTELPREVVSCDTATETGELHFLADHVDSVSDTVFQIHADGSSADYLADDVSGYGSEAVWVDYEVASHDGGATDSSGNATFSAVGGVTLGNSTGNIGGATDFDGFNDGATAGGPVFASRNNDVMVSAWFQPEVIDADLHTILGGQGSEDTTFLRARDSGDLQYAPYNGGTSNYITASNVLSAGAWTHGAVYRDIGNTAKLIVDGAVAGSASAVSGNSESEEDAIGYDNKGSRWYFEGKVGEVRWRSVLPSSPDDFLATEYNNQSDNASFFTSANPGGGGTVTSTGTLSSEAAEIAATIGISGQVTSTGVMASGAISFSATINLQRNVTSASLVAENNSSTGIAEREVTITSAGISSGDSTVAGGAAAIANVTSAALTAVAASVSGLAERVITASGDITSGDSTSSGDSQVTQNVTSTGSLVSRIGRINASVLINGEIAASSRPMSLEISTYRNQ